MPAAAAVRVLPDLREVERYEVLARRSRLRELGFHRARFLGRGTEFEQLREYTPDDEYRQIDWKATARRHRPMSRVYELERSFPLQAVREVEQVRGLVPAIDLPINFETGSAAIRISEVEELTRLGRIMADIIARNPREIFLVEGHTDAVGSNVMNLALSDRRAEAVARLARSFSANTTGSVVTSPRWASSHRRHSQ